MGPQPPRPDNCKLRHFAPEDHPPDHALHPININCLMTNDLLFTGLDGEGHFGDSTNKLNGMKLMTRKMLNDKKY